MFLICYINAVGYVSRSPSLIAIVNSMDEVNRVIKDCRKLETDLDLDCGPDPIGVIKIEPGFNYGTQGKDGPLLLCDKWDYIDNGEKNKVNQTS